jgi:hypothetical protein
MSPYDSSGVDVTLIRSFLSLTPAERIERLQEFMDFTEEIWRLNGIEPSFGDPEDAG